MLDKDAENMEEDQGNDNGADLFTQMREKN